MEENLTELKEILKTLKKSPGRTYTGKTIQIKLEIIENIKEQFLTAQIEKKNEKETVALKLEFDNVYKRIKEYLIRDTKESDTKMASFSLETVSKALPLFNGNYIELDSFLITAQLIDKTLSTEAKRDFLQYIYHAKLTSTVRTAIGSLSEPDSFETLKNLLKNRYKNTKTIPELQNSLSILFQGKMNINSYKEKITAIIDNLNQLGIKELGNEASEAEKNVIIKLNNKLALDTFKKGLNENFKATIYAARPSNLQEASELALELENEHKLSQNTILQLRRDQTHNNYRNHHFNNNNFPRNNNFNQRNNSNSAGNNNSNNGHNNFNPNRNNNYNQRNNRNSSGNNNSNDRHNNFNPNRNNNFNTNSRRTQYDNYGNSRNRQIHSIHYSGNPTGSEYQDIPDSQN